MMFHQGELPNQWSVDSSERSTLPHEVIPRAKPSRSSPRPPLRSKLFTGRVASPTIRIPAPQDRQRSRQVHPVVVATMILVSSQLRIFGGRSPWQETAVAPQVTLSSAHPTPRGPGLAPIILNRPRASTDNTSLTLVALSRSLELISSTKSSTLMP